MDPSLLQQAAEFHGPSFLWNVDNEQQMEVQSPFYSPFQSQANESLAQDHEFTEKLQKFLGQKADLLYRDPEPEAPNRASSLDDDDFYAIMPPLEAFMGIPPESAKGHLYNSLEKRDIVVGVVSSILDSGLIISLLCLDNGKARDLDQLKITAFCPVKELPKDFGNDSPVDAFQVKDKVRAVVVSVNQETQRIIVSLVSKSLPADAVYPKLGIISEDDYPVYYRRHLQIRGVTYDELLHSVMGFNNSHCVPYLMTRLGLESDSRRPPSLMRSLNSIQIPTSEYAEALRKVQSSKYAMRSVAEGISHFKAGKTLEAMQMLNKALQIDEGNVEALVARGALYANNESYTKAIEDFQGALRGNPDHSNARKYLRETLVAKGRELHDTGHYREAEEYYDKALQLERRDPEVIHYLRLCQRHEPVQVSRGSSSRRDGDREDAQSRMSGHSRHSGHSRRSDPMGHGSPPQQDSHGDFPLNQTKQKLKLLIEADRRGHGAQKHDDWSESSNRKRRVSETKYERMTSVSPSERGSRRDSIGVKERSDWSKEKSQKQQRRPQSPDTPDSRNLYGDESSSSSSSTSSGSSSDSSSSSSPSPRKPRSHRKSRSPRERHFSPSSSEKRQRYTSGDKENGKRTYGRELSVEKGRERRKYSSEYREDKERKHSRHSSGERPEERRDSSEANERRRYSVEGGERKRYSVEDSERKRYSVEDSERKRYSVEDSERKRYSVEDSERKRYSVEDSETKRCSVEDSERKRYSIEDSERKRYSVEDSERRKYLSENERKKGTDYSQVHNRPGNIVRTIISGKGYSEKDGRYSPEVTSDLSSHRQDGHGHRTEDAGLEEARSVVMSSRRSRNSEEKQSRPSPDATPETQSRNQEKPENLSPRQLPSSRQVLPRKRSRFHDADEKPFVSYEENDDRNSKFMEYLEKKHRPPELKGSPETSEKVEVHKRISPSPHRKPSPSVRSTPGKESSKALTPDPMIFQKVDSPVCRRTGALVVRENREDMPTHFRSAAAKPEATKSYREEDGKSSSLGMPDGLLVEGEKTMQSKSRRYDEIKIQVCTEKLSGGQQVRTVSGGLVLDSGRQIQAQGSSLKDRTPGNQSPGHRSEHSDNYSRAGSSRTPMRLSRDRLSDKSEKMSNLPDVVKSAGRPTRRSLEHRDDKRESRTKRNYSRSRSPHDGKRRRESNPHPYRPRQSRFDSRERKRKRDLHRRSSSSASSSSDSSSSSSSRSGSPRKSKRRRTKNEGEKPEEKQSNPSSGSKVQPPAQAKPLGPKMYLPRQVQLKSSIPHPPKSAVKTPAKPETAKPNLESKKGDKSQKELKEMESFLSQLKEKKKQQMIAEGVFDKYKKPV